MFERTGDGFKTSINPDGKGTAELYKYFRNEIDKSVDSEGIVQGLHSIDHDQLTALTALVSHLEARIIELENKLEQ